MFCVNREIHTAETVIIAVQFDFKIMFYVFSDTEVVRLP